MRTTIVSPSVTRTTVARPSVAAARLGEHATAAAARRTKARTRDTGVSRSGGCGGRPLTAGRRASAARYQRHGGLRVCTVGGVVGEVPRRDFVKRAAAAFAL